MYEMTIQVRTKFYLLKKSNFTAMGNCVRKIEIDEPIVAIHNEEVVIDMPNQNCTYGENEQDKEDPTI